MGALIIIACFGVLAMMAEVFHFKKAITFLMVTGLIAGFVVNVMEWNTFQSYYNYMFLSDNYAVAFIGLVIFITLLWVLMSQNYFTSESSRAEHASLILFALCGAIIMIGYSDLTMFFIGLEILSISLYVLAGSDKKNIRSNEAGLKYFLMGAFATGFLLFGIALIYGATATFNLLEIRERLMHFSTVPGFVYAGILMMMIGLTFKIAAVPFHFWAPDVYEGSPTLITAFMSTVVKTAAFAAFYRLFSTCFSGMSEWWTSLIAIISGLSMIVGNVLAVYQQSFKRMLAYSSIAHAGYMLMAIVAINQTSAGAIFLYAAAYSFASIGAFACLSAMSINGDENVSALAGIGKQKPFIAVLLSIMMLSMAGIPPVAGFFAKYYIFYSALQSGYVWLVIVAIISSLIGVYYYFRVIYTLFAVNPTAGNKSFFNEMHPVILAMCAILTLLLGIAPSLLQGLFP